jgi:hypothetical protein
MTMNASWPNSEKQRPQAIKAAGDGALAKYEALGREEDRLLRSMGAPGVYDNPIGSTFNLGARVLQPFAKLLPA